MQQAVDVRVRRAPTGPLPPMGEINRMRKQIIEVRFLKNTMEYITDKEGLVVMPK